MGQRENYKQRWLNRRASTPNMSCFSASSVSVQDAYYNAVLASWMFVMPWRQLTASLVSVQDAYSSAVLRSWMFVMPWHQLTASLVSVQDAYHSAVLPSWMFVMPWHQLTAKQRGLCRIVECFRSSWQEGGDPAMPIPVLFFLSCMLPMATIIALVLFF